MLAAVSTDFQPPVRRHICVVTETYAPEVNGVALTLAHLVKGLAARGHKLSVVRPRQRRNDRPDRICKDGTVLVRGLPLPQYNGLQFGLPSGRLLRRCWTEERPDVVYVATEGPLGWSAVRAGQQLGIPVFSGFHTNFDSYAIYYRVGWLRPLVFRYLRGFHNRTTGTLVADIDLRDRLQNLGFANVSFLGRGVDHCLFAPDRRRMELRRHWGASDTSPVALYVGRIAPEKNLQLAIDAYHAMQRINGSVKFVIVGAGPLLTALQRKYADIIFGGVQTGEALATHYASADLFLFPSETETFGNVTLEAMASGLLVIAYNYAAAKIHIVNDDTGLLIPCGDSKAFVDAAVRFACTPESFNRIRRQAREYVASIGWPSIIARFEALLTGGRSHRRDPQFLANGPEFGGVAAMGRI